MGYPRVPLSACWTTTTHVKKLSPLTLNLGVGGLMTIEGFGLALGSEDKKEHKCHFKSALQIASIENLFILLRRLYSTIEPISWSLPLFIYHQEHIVHAFCEALIVSDSPSSANQLEQSSSKTRVSGQSKKYQPSDLKKDA
ncbi:hypothetical protein VP01_3229g7 [Puccinia sorghi]|uniref:Uncharacterized protein n=1 Tax=Puccinia sorghi TaxID=27349 RepID=A0A0L6UY78_9BASI|nr:hypothetical protein VP01_3229g7 [Puccinia sorghi]